MSVWPSKNDRPKCLLTICLEAEVCWVKDNEQKIRSSTWWSSFSSVCLFIAFCFTEGLNVPECNCLYYCITCFTFVVSRKRWFPPCHYPKLVNPFTGNLGRPADVHSVYPNRGFTRAWQFGTRYHHGLTPHGCRSKG